MARKGSFGTSLTPFGQPDTDLSAYQLGTAAPAPSFAPAQPSWAQEPWLNPNFVAVAGGSWTSGSDGGWTYTPPPKPTVAPEPGVQPEPVVPTPQVPTVNYAQAAITMQGYVNTLSAVQNPTAAQSAALAVDQQRLAYNVAQLSPAEVAAAAAVSKMQNYVNILSAVKNPTAAQSAALAIDLAQLARNQAALAAAQLAGG